jgi:di/tricarboxylate transporter
MTPVQIAALGIVAGMLALFLSDRLRYDLVAGITLSCAIAVGVVPPARAFSGFANSAIVIIGAALVLSRAVAVSGVIDDLINRMLRRVRATSLQVGILAASVALLSAFMKNVGALGLVMPIALRAAKRSDRPPSAYLMPLSFASLVGGTITGIGTSPNILISTVRQQTSGHPYALLDFVPVGLPVTLSVIGFLILGWRLLPQRRGQASAEERFEIGDYTSEVRVLKGSPLAGRTVRQLEERSDGDISVSALIRDNEHRYVPGAHWQLSEGDVLVLRGDPAALQSLVEPTRLELLGAERIAQSRPRSKEDDVEAVEAVISAHSPIIGQTLESLHLRRNYEVNLLAISRVGQFVSDRLREVRFQFGDVVVLQGRHSQLQDALTEFGCLPLAERHLAVAQPRARTWPLLILAAAVVVSATRLLPLEVAFFMAAGAVVLCGQITPREAYSAIDWPVLVMLGCLIPIGESLRDTGAAATLAQHLAWVANALPPTLAVGVVLLVTMLATPFLHHVAAVLVFGPIAVAVAASLNHSADPFLMAVALGASCDFLTPIGHQNNALIMGPAGYRFGDYGRLGLPLSCLVTVAGTWLIVQVWPL